MFFRLCALLICIFTSTNSLFFPYRSFVALLANVKCDGPVETTATLFDEDHLEDDVLAIKHVFNSDKFSLEGFESETTNFEPYVQFLGTCNGKPHLRRFMIPASFVYADQKDRKVLEITFDLN